MFLETADPIGFWVVTLNCSNVKNVVEQDILRTKRMADLFLRWRRHRELFNYEMYEFMNKCLTD